MADGSAKPWLGPDAPLLITMQLGPMARDDGAWRLSVFAADGDQVRTTLVTSSPRAVSTRLTASY